MSNATKQGLKLKWERVIALLVRKPPKSSDYGVINVTRDT
jgi:hypothetical protein